MIIDGVCTVTSTSSVRERIVVNLALIPDKPVSRLLLQTPDEAINHYTYKLRQLRCMAVLVVLLI